MKILGIGNAIVDVICKVDDDFINQNNLTKGTMKLIFKNDEFQSMLSSLNIEKTISGGSVANSIVGLSQLGNKVGFIGKVNDDLTVSYGNHEIEAVSSGNPDQEAAALGFSYTMGSLSIGGAIHDGDNIANSSTNSREIYSLGLTFNF